jgi:mandelate racemase
VQARAVIAPLPAPVRTASGSVTQALLLLIDLYTEEGPVGRAYLFSYQPFALRPLRDLVLGLGETIKGYPVAPIDLDRALRTRFTLFGGARGLQGMAVAGIDMAAWDALAVSAGVPLATLLGGAPRTIPAYNSLGMIPADDLIPLSAASCAESYER